MKGIIKMNYSKIRLSGFGAASAIALMAASAASADIVHLDDVIVGGSMCVGFDCVNGESFGFDTLRLKENNLRIKFQDTSASASFPSRDWQITVNDSSNGGLNKFSIDDIDGGRTPFTIEADAPSHSLYVDDGGRIGLGTSTPVVDLHIKTGNTPTLRLEQDGSSGFTPQTWDVAGNEANFFVRDATNGSTLPFRIEPGSASNSIYIDSTNNVGFGTTNPTSGLHVVRASSTAEGLLKLQNNGTVFMTLDNGNIAWNIQNNSDELRFTNATGPGIEMRMTSTGDMTISGQLVTGTAGSCATATPCDAVFDPAIYTVPSLVQYNEQMWANGYLPTVGPTLADQPMNVSDKMLKMLNALEHAQIYIGQLETRISALESKVTVE